MQDNNDFIDISVESPSISVEQILYDVFYRQKGIRRINQLDNPIISDIGGAVLPKFSIYHYNPESPLLLGPLENNPWYINDKSLRFIQHVVEFPFTPIGTIIKKPGNVNAYIQAYRKKHRTLRLLRDFFGVNRTGNMLMVVNYCLLNQLWKYRPHRLSNYYKFYNLYQTILMNMNKLAAQSDRQQYLEVRLPQVVLPRAELRMLAREYDKGVSNRHITRFKDEDDWLLFHLWMWVGSQQEYSIFNKIDAHHLDKINILLTDQGKYTVLNLGLLNKWRTLIADGVDEDGNIVSDLETTDDNVSERLQIKFYKLLSLLVANRTGSGVRAIDVPTYSEQELNDETATVDDNEVLEETPIVTSEPTTTSTTPTMKDIVEKAGEFTTGEKKEEAPSTKKNLIKALPKLDDNGNVVEELEDTAETQMIVEDDLQNTTDDNEETIPELSEEPTEVIPQDSMSAGILEDAMELVEAGMMTAKQYARLKEKASSYKTAPSPYIEGETLEQTATVSDELVNTIEKRTVPDTPWILDKSMLTVTTEAAREQYITKVYQRDITRSILGIQRGGVLVTDIKREEVKDTANHYEILSVKMQPVDGVENTVKIKLPVIAEDGSWTNNGVRYYKKLMRRDKVIRKVSPTRVALTTYYGKLFVEKSDRKVFNIEKYYINNIQAKMFDGLVYDVSYGNVFDKSLKHIHPYYQMLSKRFDSFGYRDDNQQDWVVSFNYATRYELLQDQKTIDALETQLSGTLFAVNSKTRESLYIHNTSGLVYSSNINLPPIPLDKFFNITQTPPVEIAEMKIFSKVIPVGLLLGYYLGLTNLCKLLQVKPRKIFRGQRADLLNTEYQIQFGDESWIFDKRDYKASLILNGFNLYKRYLSDYSVQQFEDKDVYMAIFRDAGIPLSYENEFKMMKRLFIDDISRQMLNQMKEPTEFIPLIIRAVELLTTLWSRDEINMEDMVISGYDTIAGHVYSELVRNLKAANGTSVTARKRFDLPEDRIMQMIQKDPSVALLDDINPLHNLKEHDLVTFNGSGGRSGRSMVAHTRAYNESDLGIISEATVDNANVGTITYLSGNPNIANLYGNTEVKDISELASGNIFSTSALLGVAGDTDDAKRLNFKSIQDSHGVNIAGSIPSPVRTGYETVVAHRVDKQFAWVAKENGKVVERSDNHIMIRYDSGKEVRVQIGSIYGVSTGTVIKNRLITDYVVGQTVNAGDVVCYNPFHFTRDIFNKTQVLFKNSALARTTLMESNDTEEDSSAISKRLSKELETVTTEVRTLVIPFTDRIEKLVMVGDTVEDDSNLCTIINAVFTDNNMFGENELETLGQLAQSSPKAKHAGFITKIEVVYYGDPNTAEVSDSVKAIIKRYDAERKQLALKMKDGRPESGLLLQTINVGKDKIPLNHIGIKIYIENNDGMGVGDKLVVSNQLKSVVARVMSGTNETESGKPIDAIFGYQSISNRIVQSAELIGTTNVLLKLITQEVIDTYRQSYPKK